MPVTAACNSGSCAPAHTRQSSAGNAGTRRWRPVTSTDMNHLSERLFRILSQPDFLSMKGQANDVPIFILPYEPEQEDAASRMVESLPANPGDAIARRAEHRAMCQASGVSRAGFFRGWWSRGL